MFQLRGWALGVCVTLFIPIKDRDGREGKGRNTQTMGNLDRKTFKYLKCQICFSVSLI